MRTRLTISDGRVEMRTRVALQCVDCGHQYHPQVHSHPEWVIAVGAVTVLVLLGLLGLWLAGRIERTVLLWAKVGATLVAFGLGWHAMRLQRRLMEPKFHSREMPGEPEFGAILLGCPRCGSAKARVSPEEWGSGISPR